MLRPLPGRLLAGCLVALLVVPAPAAPQPADPALQAPAADSSVEDPDDLVVEYEQRHVAFDDEGTRTDEVETRIRVNSPAGVQQAGTVMVVFRQAATLDVRYVRVRKPDGAVVDTPLTATFDLPAPVTQTAPTYSDLYVRHINVQALEPGDVLEYAWRLREPSLLPGHFWFADPLSASPGVLEMSWPARFDPIVKSPDVEPSRRTEDGRTIYRWAFDASGDDDTPVDVQVTSFRDWAEVGAAFRDLWRGRAEPTPALATKAAELTAGLESAAEKAEALYRFVAADVRYVAVAIGIGRYQPNAAEAVLASRFGDCKDKHVLLEALLRAVDIDATPVLIGPGIDLDVDVPIPSAFSHVVTLVHDEALEAPVWLDTTLEVAPFGHVVDIERDVNVLSLPASGPPALLKTPAEPARAASWTTELDGRLSLEGVLDATVRETVSGDFEVLVRQLFRSAGRQHWERLVEAFPLSQQRAGTISDVRVAPPEETDDPFRIEYRYVVDDYVNWSNGRLRPPIVFDIAAPTDPPAEGTIEIGPPATTLARVRLELPRDVEVDADGLSSTHLERTFGEYRLRSSLDGHVMTTERQFVMRSRELPAAQYDEYRSFVETARRAPRMIDVSLRRPWSWTDAVTIRWYEADDENVEKRLRETASAGRRGDYQEAIAMARRLIDQEPENDAAWLLLGWAQYASGSRERGLATLRQRLPGARSPSIVKYLGERLRDLERGDEALEVWRQGYERFPDDLEFARRFGDALIEAGRFAEAVDVFERHASAHADSGRFHVRFGDALLGAGRREEAAAVFARAGELDADAFNLNEAAWRLADAGLDPSRARTFALAAVDQTTRAVNDLRIATIDDAGIDLVGSLAEHWNTLGWALFRLEQHEAARRYLQSAWLLSGRPIHAEHLAELEEAAGATGEAAQLRVAAEIMRGRLPPRLTPEAQQERETVRSALLRTRTFTIDVNEAPAVPFEVLLRIDTAGRVAESAVVGRNPAAEVTRAARALVGASMPWPAPDDAIEQVVRKAAVSCATGATTCSVVLQPVTSVSRVGEVQR